MKIKLLTLDLDGTLLDAKKEIPERNIRALQACERRGIRIALISGRAFELLRGFGRAMGISPILAACNGAQIHMGEDEPILAETTFAEADARRVIETLDASGMYYNVYRRGLWYMGNAHVQPLLGSRYAHHIPGKTEILGLPYERICDDVRLHTEGTLGVQKFVVMGMPYDPGFERIEEELKDMKLSVSSASRRNREFMPTGVDKGYAVRMICKELGIDRSEVMAFGDQTNDLPMFRAAGWPVAMENGEDVVKAESRLIAPHHDLGGVGIVLEKYVLGDEEI